MQSHKRLKVGQMVKYTPRTPYLPEDLDYARVTELGDHLIYSLYSDKPIDWNYRKLHVWLKLRDGQSTRVDLPTFLIFEIYNEEEEALASLGFPY